MKKSGIINAQLAGYIAGLGHKDQFMIGDGGRPFQGQGSRAGVGVKSNVRTVSF